MVGCEQRSRPLVVMAHELPAGRDLGDPGDEALALRPLAGDQQLPANPCAGREAGVFSALPIEGGLIDESGFWRAHRLLPPG